MKESEGKNETDPIQRLVKVTEELLENQRRLIERLPNRGDVRGIFLLQLACLVTQLVLIYMHM